VQVNLLRIDEIERPAAAFVDGRTMERVSRSDREQEDLIVQRSQRQSGTLCPRDLTRLPPESIGPSTTFRSLKRDHTEFGSV
jgi:hypothetical protein